MMKTAQYVLIVILALSLLAPVFLSWQPPAKADTALSFQEQAHPYLPNDPSRFDPSVGIGAGINIPPPFLVENYGYTCAATYGFATSTATGVTQTQFPNLVFRGWAGSAQLPGCGLAGSVGGSLPSLQNNLTFSLFLTPTAPSTTISFQYYYYSTSTGNSFYIVLTYTLLGSSTVVGIGSRIATSSTSGPIQSFSVSVTLTSPICLRFSVARSAFINDYAIIRNLNITGAQINNMPSSSRPCLPNDTPNLKFIDYSTGNPRDLVGSVSSPLSSPVYITYKSNIPFNFNDLIEYLPFDGSDSNSFLRNRALPGGLATTNTTSTSYMPSFVSSGKFGGAAQFATGGTYNPAVLSDIKLPPLNAFTVSFWFKYISGTGYAPIVGFGNIISNYVLEVNNGGQLKVEMCSTGATLNPNSAVNLLDGAWHYIAFVFTSPTSVIGYVDGGSASASLSANFVTSGTPTLAPGVCGAKGAGGLTIQLDDFRIYARALSSSEVNALYTMTSAQYSSQRIPNPNLPNLFGGYTTIGTQGSQLIYGGVKTSALFVPQLFNYSATAQVTVWYGSYYYRTLVINPNLQSYYGGVWGQYLNVYIDDPSRVVPYVINVIDLAKIFPPGSIVAVLSGNSTIITSGLLDTSMTVFAYLVPGTYNVLLMNPSGQKMNFLVNFGSLSSINIIVPGSNLVVNPGGLPFLSASFIISCDLKTAYLSFTDSYQITASVTFKLYVANVTGNYLVAQQTVTGTVGNNGLSNIGTASVTLTGIPTGATIDQIYAIVNATSLSSVPSSVPAQPYGRVVTTIQPGGTSGTCPGLVVGTPPSFPGDVLGLSQIFPFPNAWLFLLSVSLILMVGFAFSARDADVGTFIMLLMAAAFMAMGWLPLIPGWIITLLFIAFVRLALSRWRRRRMGA